MELANNKYISTAITIGLGLYAALLGPNLPKFVKDLFTNTLFRILVLFLVVVRGNKDPQMAIMIAIAFVLTLDYIYVKDAKETFQMLEGMADSTTGLSSGLSSGSTTGSTTGLSSGTTSGSTSSSANCPVCPGTTGLSTNTSGGSGNTQGQTLR